MTLKSGSVGCEYAADYFYDFYDALGLAVEYHEWSPSHAPNVIATLEGAVNPDNVYIMIGHLDDLPQFGPAPGADDNASGSVYQLAAAEAMSCYAFKNSGKGTTTCSASVAGAHLPRSFC